MKDSLSTEDIAELAALPEMQARARIDAILEGKSHPQQRRIIRGVMAGLKAHAIKHQSSVDSARAALSVLEPYAEWIQLKPALEQNDCSRLHRLREAAAAGKLMNPEGGTEQEDPGWLNADFKTFVVRHDWGNALEHAEGIDDSWRLPYEVCTFEFRVTGRNCIVAVAQRDESLKSTMFIEFGEYWLNPSNCTPAFEMMWSQVRAICIALDAEVAVTEVIRAPAKLNEKRAKAGKPPLPDYRVVDLARRHRIANPAASAPGTGTKKRLHFRRGHWRHYETSRTWIKWQLVGSPDLGFINKHYRL